MVTPAYKWLRAVGDHEFTGLHIDRVFMGRSARMLTAWIPLGNIPVDQGPLLVRNLSLFAFSTASFYGQALWAPMCIYCHLFQCSAFTLAT